MIEPIKEYEKEVQRLQKEIARETASRQVAESNYKLIVQKIKEERKKHEIEIKQLKHNIDLLNAALDDLKAGRI